MLVSFDRVLHIKLLLFDLMYDIAFASYVILCLFIKKIKFFTCSICTNSNTLSTFVIQYNLIFGYPLTVTRMLFSRVSERFCKKKKSVINNHHTLQEDLIVKN